MSPLSREDLNKLSIMFEGDKSRDATPSIRGFLFQDYIVINFLLQEGVECVCSEYLEDVDVFYEDGRFEFIQAKYYPQTNPNQHMKEIFTDLYYQYLRLQMLRSSLTALPKLYIHTNPPLGKQNPDEVKKSIDLGSQLSETAIYPDAADAATWLRKNVYSKEVTNKQGKKETKKQNKAEQKNSLFTQMASKDSLNAFSGVLEVVDLPNIDDYKYQLMKALAASYPNPNPGNREDNWQMILLGLAISRVQQRYVDGSTDFLKLRVGKREFDEYMRNSVQTKSEQTIASYLVAIVARKYAEIMNDNELSDLQANMLKWIYRNTINWIGEIGATINGQYRLLNTISKDEHSQIDGYTSAAIDDRLISMAECKDAFAVFLGYLWKIMLNICQDNVTDMAEMDDYSELFDPKHYIVSSVTDYVCLNFPEDKYIYHSVILPRAGSEFKGIKRKIVGRMMNVSPKPEKWFFENNKLTRGKNYYSYSTANVNENPSVVDLGEDSFYVECMDCIGIDEDEWNIQESCGDCIFSMKCKKEGAL